ncbi:MAG: type II secretion system minor pseudopilin GspK [Pseudomonadota bacterium]
MRPAPQKQRGIALVVVLWLSLLLTILVGSFAIVARTENLQARHLFDTTRAWYAAEAGLHRAVFELRNPNLEERWFADGRTYTTEFEGATVEISVTDETGKIDLNVADELLLGALFQSAGVEPEASDLLVDAVLDWRDPDDLVRLNGAEDDDYEAAEYPYGAKDAPFDTVTELQQVMGMNYELFVTLEPALTVYTGRARPDPAFAPREVLMTIDGMTEELATEFIDQREQIEDFGVPLPILPDGTEAVARAGSYTYSIKVKATLPNDAWAELEATIRPGGAIQGRPFRIVRWKDS